MKTLSVEQSRELDARAIRDAGIPGETLMERAGEGAAVEILDFAERLRPWNIRRFVLLAGKGNNGGDAHVVARVLFERSGAETAVFSICPISELKGDALLNAHRLPAETALSEGAFPEFRDGDLIIDGLLGTGAKGAPRAPYSAWIEAVNAANLPVVSLDIPSGLDGDTGKAAGAAVKADMTVTMAFPKNGLLLGRGPESTGILRVVDIGIPAEFAGALPSPFDTVTATDVAPLLARRPFDAHKRSLGVVLVVGGSFDYPGAPLLSAEAAAKAGAGLVAVAVPRSAEIPPPPNARHLVFRRVDDDGNGTFSRKSREELIALAETADALAIGPGLTTAAAAAEAIEPLLELDKPTILDADALNLLARGGARFPRNRGNIAATPHPGEARRLAEWLGVDIDGMDAIGKAKSLAAAMGTTILLKGPRSVIASADGSISLNGSGSPALATAGSGDVLTGIAAAYAAGGASPRRALEAAAFIHGLAAELSFLGQRGLTADALAEMIPEAAKTVSPFA